MSEQAEATIPAGLDEGLANLRSKIDHVVVLMLENRSFDHMLGFLYAGNGNRSPSGQEFDGLTGNESTARSTRSGPPRARP